MKILMTGAAGMLGSTMYPILREQGHEVITTDINTSDKGIELLDVKDKEAIYAFITKYDPDAVFHLAAETDVDKSEIEVDHVHHVNVIGTQNVALACQEYDKLMIYISTAGVFSGDKEEPYTEFDDPRPVNVYGKTKLEGEKIVRELLNKFFILRAGWMVGGGVKDKKFVMQILKLIKSGKKEIPVVTDKIGSPTYTGDFSRNIMPLVESKRYGLYHMTCKGRCSRFDVAKKIVNHLNYDVKINPITSDKFPLPAPRAASEMMRNFKMDMIGLNNMQHWEAALEEYLDDLKKKKVI